MMYGKHVKQNRGAAKKAAAVLLAILMTLGCAVSSYAAEKTGISMAPGILQRSDTGIAAVGKLWVEDGRLHAEGDVIGNNGVVAASLHDETNGYIASSPAANCKGKAFSLSFNLIRGTLEDGTYYVVFGDIENEGISVRDLWGVGYRVSFEVKDNQVLNTWKGEGSTEKTPSAAPEPSEKPEPETSKDAGEAQRETERTTTVSDIGGHWAEKEIQALLKRGMLSGYEDGSFRPEAAITRAEFAQIASSVFGIKASEEKKNPSERAAAFADVSQSDWYWNAVTALFECGIVSGVSENRFAPEEPISREQMTVILCSAAKYKQMDLAIKRDYMTFTDDSELSDYAKEAVKTMYQAELISGVGSAEGNRFLPQKGATRAEVAAIVHQLLNRIE